MRQAIYTLSVVLAAVGLFWPILYGNIAVLRELPGDPVVQAALMVVVFGALAYLTYGESSELPQEG